MANRFVFIRGNLEATVRARPVVVHGRTQLPYGKAFFCPTCAEVWMLAPVEGEETYVEHYLCDRHPSSPSRPAGILTSSHDEEWNRELPEKILARDFLMLFNEKDKSDGQQF